MPRSEKPAAQPSVQDQPPDRDTAIFRARVHQELSHIFVQNSIVQEVERRVLQKWLESPTQSTGEELPDLHIQQAIGDYFADLRSHCLAYIRQLLRDPERAEDLVQEALLRLISEQSQLQHIRAWLRQVIYHLVVEQYHQDKAQSEFLLQLRHDADKLRQLACLQDLIPDYGEIGVILPEMLANPDFLALQEIQRHTSLGAWAQAHQLTYEQARQRSKVHRRNLKAACLRKLGWAKTPDILNYREYKSIQRYLRELFRAGTQAALGKEPPSRFKSFTQELHDCWQGIVKFHNWDISDLGDSRYKLYIVGVGSSQVPILLNVLIHIKANRRIVTDRIRRNEMIGRMELPPGYRLPLDKGKCLLSRQQMEDLIRPIK